MNNYYKKYIKYKNKYINLLNNQIQGGRNSTPIESNIQEITIEDINNDIVTQNREICGIINNDKIYLTMIGPIPDSSNGIRASCQLGHYNETNTSIIWHTHPITEKFYPSVEDICKVMKYQVTYCYLFTSKLRWKIVCNSIYDKTIIDTYKKGIDEINNKLYFKYNNYNTRDPLSNPYYNSILTEYINNLNNYLSNFNFNISYVLN
jgi:hypothetical protein